MALDKNSIFEIEQRYVDPVKEIDNPNVHIINNRDRLSISPKSLLGYYLEAIELFFKETNREVVTNPFFQENFVPNNTTPVLFINRGVTSPAILSTPGDTYRAVQLDINGIEDINTNESKAASFLISQQMDLRIYSANRAELEILAYDLYKLLLAISDDVLTDVFPEIIRVNLPTMDSIQPDPRGNDYYFTQMQWEILFKECNILIFKEKLLKYSRLIVHDDNAKEILK